MSEQPKNTSPNTGLVSRLWKAISSPSTRLSAGALVGVGIVGGIIFWGGFNWAMELTNTEEFCISCHEMASTVYPEYKESVHYQNTSGVRVICTDCHVPNRWHYKVVRKVKATNELFHKILGSVDSLEKFEAKRLQMARNVWMEMEATDSRECRNCHTFDAMKIRKQGKAARKKHERAKEEGQTCIECHKGIAHQLPDGWDEEPES